MPYDGSGTGGRATSRARIATEPSAAQPLYATLARELAEAIRAGRYPEGALLPTEAALAEARAVSRQTVREAFRRLEQQGLVSRRRGVGTRVEPAGTAARRFVLDIGSLGDLAAYARQVRLQVESMAPVAASAALAAELGCRTGSRWIEIRGTRHPVDAPDTAVAVVRMWIRAGYPGVERRLRGIGPRAVHQMLEEDYGEQIDEIEQSIDAIAMDVDDARRLGVAGGSPGLRIHRRFLGRGARVVFVGHVVYPGGAFTHTGRFRRDRG